MKHFRIFLISLLAFCLNFPEEQRGCCHVTVCQPPSPNITHLLAVSGKQSLKVSWLVYHSDLEGHIDEVQISRTENHIIIYSENVSVPADVAEYTWTWTSDLPLECVDHSVRIRHFCSETVLSPWSGWTTNPGVKPKDKTEAFPFQRVLREGSSAMFCCVPPPGVNITNMDFYNKMYPLISIGARVKAIAVNNLTIPTTHIKILTLFCSDTTGNISYVENYVSFPPQKIRNLTCVTSDMISVTCTWDTSRKQYPWDRNHQTQTLYIENTDQAPITCQELSCTFPAIQQLEEYNVRVVVKNQLGEETESHSFNISDRVFPVVHWDRLSPEVTDATVSWILKGNLTQLKLLCQVTTEPHSITELRCNSMNSPCRVKLEHLLPNTHYSTRVRCSANGRFWGKWTKPKSFTTRLLVKLNLWRKIKLHNSQSRQVTLLWTQHVPGSASVEKIQKYTVQWSHEGHNGTQRMDVGDSYKQVEVSIGPGQYNFTVQPVLLTGLSIPAHITIPKMDNRANHVVEKQLSSSTVGGFNLTWAQQVTATCGYTVEWCIKGTTASCDLQWKNVPEGDNTLNLPDSDFNPGCKNTFNIYECTEDGHKLLEKQTGYSQELKCVQSPSLVESVHITPSSVTLKWDYDDAYPALMAFIIGYLVTVQDALPGHPTQNLTVSDSQKKSVTIEDLQQNHDYVLSVRALTKKGPGQSVTVTIRTRIDVPAHLAKILTPIILLLCCISLLWPQRKMLKNGVKEIFSYPAGMNIKVSELENFLNETSETVLSEEIEECISCDIEILNTVPPLSDTAALRDPEPMKALPSPVSHSSLLLQADYCPQSATLLYYRPPIEQITCITNKSYIPSMVEFEASDCQQESCCVEYGYISNDTL